MNPNSTRFVGFDNFAFIFTDPSMRQVLINNLLWLVLVTGGAVVAGLIIALLVDRIGRAEPIAKSLIFLPMAISAVGRVGYLEIYV